MPDIKWKYPNAQKFTNVFSHATDIGPIYNQGSLILFTCLSFLLVLERVCRLHYCSHCNCAWMRPNENAANYYIRFYPKSTRMIQQFRADGDERSYLSRALERDEEWNHAIFLVDDGHCYAAGDVRKIGQSVVIAVVEYAYTMKESQRKGHYKKLLSFLYNDLKLQVVLYNGDKKFTNSFESLGFHRSVDRVGNDDLTKWVG